MFLIGIIITDCTGEREELHIHNVGVFNENKYT